MQALLLSPAQPRPPRPLPSVVTSASAQRASALCSAASYASVRSSLSRLGAPAAGSPASGPSEPAPQSTEDAKLAQVSKKLEKTAQYFKNLGSLGFWSQLVCTTISAGIFSFSAVATGKLLTAFFTLCATAIGILAAFVSVYRSFGYLRLSESLQRTAKEPSKAPPRANVVKNLRNNIFLNVLGMGAAVLGMQATLGALVPKALTTSPVPYYQGIPPGQRSVHALDIVLIQASANTILSHFLGLSFSLELLRSVTKPQSDAPPVPKPA